MDNGTIGPATDQFAFCIALWEALTNERPFRGENTTELRAAVERGLTKVQLRKVAGRYRGALARGLHPDPTQRWPSVEILLGELQRRSRQSKFALATVLVIGVLYFLVPLIWGVLRGRDMALEEIESRGNPRVAEIKQQGSGAFEVTPAAMSDIVDELHLGKTARFVPTFADGKAIGFKVDAIKRTSLLLAIGLVDGDVVTAIDGKTLLSSSDDFTRVINKKRRYEEALRFDLLRNGTSIVINVRVGEIPISPD